MSSTMPTRVDGDLFDAAKSVAAVNSRSAAQQINHWARIGREFEASGQVSQRDVERVLAGDGSYDELSERAQAVVRADWDEQIAERIAGLDLEAELTDAGDIWSEADAGGRVFKRG
jgi:hypothetical protein